MKESENPKIVGATVFVGVYGSIHLHPWIKPELLSEDFYSMFMARSTSMMWSSASLNPPSTDLWGMNDAGQEWSPRDPSSRIAWVQVGLSNESAGARRLPIQPIVACVKDSLSRFGEVALIGIQLLLPVQLAGPAHSPLVSGLNWFNDCDPDARASIRITLDAGRDDYIRQKAAEIFTTLQQLNTGPFTFHSYSLDESLGVQLEPNVVGDMWLGQGRHPVTVEATVPDWNFDAVGWIVELCAEACRQADITTTVLVSVSSQATKQDERLASLQVDLG